MAAARAGRPAKKDVAGGLHQQVTHDDALPTIGVYAASGVCLEHGGARLLHLQKKWILRAGHQEHHPADSADAADSHDLERGVPYLIAIEEDSTGFRQRAAVAAEGIAQQGVESRVVLTAQVINGRRLVANLDLLASGICQSGEVVVTGTARALLGNAPINPCADTH